MVQLIEIRVTEKTLVAIVLLPRVPQNQPVNPTNPAKAVPQWKVAPGTRLEILFDGVVQTGKQRAGKGDGPYKLKRDGANLQVVDHEGEVVLALTDFFVTQDVLLLGQDWVSSRPMPATWRRPSRLTARTGSPRVSGQTPA